MALGAEPERFLSGAARVPPAVPRVHRTAQDDTVLALDADADVARRRVDRLQRPAAHGGQRADRERVARGCDPLGRRRVGGDRRAGGVEDGVEHDPLVALPPRPVERVEAEHHRVPAADGLVDDRRAAGQGAG